MHVHDLFSKTVPGAHFIGLHISVGSRTRYHILPRDDARKGQCVTENNSINYCSDLYYRGLKLQYYCKFGNFRKGFIFAKVS